MDRLKEFARRATAAQQAVDEIVPRDRAAVTSESVARMRNALELVLLFHSGGEWDEVKAAKWNRLTQHREPTTRVLCDCVREALKE
jgi:hypothetical protein